MQRGAANGVMVLVEQADLLRDSDLDAAISQSLDEAAASPQKPTAKSFLETIRRSPLPPHSLPGAA